jgi:hypothetical protein
MKNNNLLSAGLPELGNTVNNLAPMDIIRLNVPFHTYL